MNNYSHRPASLMSDILELKEPFIGWDKKIVKEEVIVIKIDEWVVSRNKHPHKFWSLKGEKAELKSITFTTSISIIISISTDGWIFTHI